MWNNVWNNMNSSSEEMMAAAHPPPPATHHRRSSSITEETKEAAENEDAIADRLLVQFPTYGAGNQMIMNQNVDWLLGGTREIPNQQQLAIKQQQLMLQELHQQEIPGEVESAFSQSNSNPKPLKTYKGWDEEEQGLWQPAAEQEINSPSLPPLGHHHHNKTSSSPSVVGKKPLLDPAKDWLQAYYYHTGVTPDFSSYKRPQTQHSSSSSPFQHPGRIDTKTSTFLDSLHEITEDDDSSEEESQNNNKSNDDNDGLKEEDDRQHWMPDRLCKQCYACDTQFTVFRRRHHCRICGQVFCNTCSGYFVPRENSDSIGMILSPSNAASLTTTTNNNNTINNNNNNNNNKTNLRTCKDCYEQVTADSKDPNDQNIHKQAQRRKMTTTTATTKMNNKHPQESPSLRTTTTTPLLETHFQKQQSLLSDLSKLNTPQSVYTKRRLASQQQAMELEEKEQTSKLWLRQTDIPKKDQTASTMLLELSDKNTPTSTENDNISNFKTTHPETNPVPPQVREGNRHLRLTAANHLEKMAESLLKSDAPLLVFNSHTEKRQWLDKLLSLATKIAFNVSPNVQKGDLLDIRPYVKVKSIPGGSPKDSQYISGVLFRHNVSHKQMARKTIYDPSIMLLSGGIEFLREENRIASLDILLEQETKYMEILVSKILKLKPNILLVGRSVSRRAQELFLQHNVVLVQHVKASVLKRISRQTGATIISSTDHIMNQFGAHVLGKCHRFRIVVARDNEIWQDSVDTKNNLEEDKKRCISSLLQNKYLTHHERQEALAASQLGQEILDGSVAVTCGLAKRGVASTYVLLEGCPKSLGCTVILRGASRATLKQVKIVFRFLVNVSYNLHLETCYLKERCALISTDYEVSPANLYSSSLCVDYGHPSRNKARPWNGGGGGNASDGQQQQRSISGDITAYDHQSILISSVWMTDKTQCCPAEVKGICYYSMQDVSLGQFLRDSCFNLSLKCQNLTCKKSVLDHSLSFVHNDGFINITVDHMDEPLPPQNKKNTESSDDIATWTYCQECGQVVTPLTYISHKTWKFSFGKFLESFFYNRQLVMNSPSCSCSCKLQTSSTHLFFGCGRLAARFTYEQVRPFNVYVRKSLPIDVTFHCAEALRQLQQISMSSSLLFVKFDKHIEKVSREARSLFGNISANRPEHLNTVLSELNKISSEVDHAAKTLQEKIASVSDKIQQSSGVMSDALFRFPWFARRYLYMLTSAWNEKLSAAGQAIVAMKKISSPNQRNDHAAPSNDSQTEELHEGMRRLRQLHEVYSRYNITDITTVLPIIPSKQQTDKHQEEYDDDFEDPSEAVMDFSGNVDADVLASRRRLNAAQKQKVLPETIPNPSVTSSTKVTPGGAVKSAITRFFNRGGRESDPYVVDLGMFSEGRPRLEPGVSGIVIPVIDEQMSTAIAYSLSSEEYAAQFETYCKDETPKNSISTTKNEGASDEGSTDTPSIGRNAFKESNNSKSSIPNSIRDKEGIERRILVRNKSHIKHTFRDFDEKGQNLCKFVVTTYWATQFHAVREAFLSPSKDDNAFASSSNSISNNNGLNVEQAFVQSLSSAYSWAASGGKSGASFARTSDDRFVIKHISKTELQMFLECAPAYFEYLSKVFFHGL
jgi:hypothetical protein